ncbi:hypothetical protein GOD21_30475 [Sinorhizobium medicae]|nr:hypothetical protein [Sinorhizobium medicae]
MLRFRAGGRKGDSRYSLIIPEDTGKHPIDLSCIAAGKVSRHADIAARGLNSKAAEVRE